MANQKKIRVLFVCLGNICRSPMAEGIFRHKIRTQKLDSRIETDSCGTGGWHVGELPDSRAQMCMKDHHIDITDLRARQFSEEDFETFDWIVCMDQSNFEGVSNLIYDPASRKKVVKMLNYHPDPLLKDVPDPYFGAHNGFENVYTMLDVACDEFLKVVLQNAPVTP